MLIKQAILREIKEGRVSLQFRRWKRPTVKAGGTLLSSVGQLAIHTVEPVELDSLTEADAFDAGFESLDELRDALHGAGGQTYRIRLSFARPDPRITMREEKPNPEELRSIIASLDRRDARSSSGPWTRLVLQLIAQNPSTRAADLAARVGMEKRRFKSLVRGLKSMGLTVSEEVGYRLSQRGKVVLRALAERRED